MMLRIVLYLRVSQDRNRRYTSVDEQDSGCREAVDERELGEIVARLGDNDLSASEYATKDRPGFLELRRVVAAGEVDVVCVWEASRISRVMSVYVDFRDLCRKHSVKVFVADSDRMYDFSRPADRRAFLDEGGDSELESGKSSRRILRSVKARASEGRPHGKILFGYRREYDPTSGELLRQVIDEGRAPYVREAARRVLAGEAPNAVAVDFNARGVPPPRAGEWDLTRIRRILTNPGYIARRMHKGTDAGPAQWPAILDQDVFYALQAKLTDPSRRNTRDTTVKHLLSGIAQCGICGATVRVIKNRGYLTYTCWPRNGRTGFHVGRREPRVDAYVTWYLFERLSQPDAREWLAAAGGEDEHRRHAREEAEAKRARLEGFFQEAEVGRVSAEAYGRMERKLTPEIEQAEQRARPPHLPGALSDLIRSTPEQVAGVWEDLDFTVKRDVLRAAVTVRLMPVGRGRRNADPRTSIRVEFAGEA